MCVQDVSCNRTTFNVPLTADKNRILSSRDLRYDTVVSAAFTEMLENIVGLARYILYREI